MHSLEKGMLVPSITTGGGLLLDRVNTSASTLFVLAYLLAGTPFQTEDMSLVYVEEEIGTLIRDFTLRV